MDGSPNKKNSFRETLAVYAQWPIASVFLLGLASGFPLLLVGSTLAARLSESGVNIKTIGIFALVGLPYTLKFLWAPLVDALRLPFARSHLAHRKAWAILSQIMLSLCLGLMAIFHPEQNTAILGFLALSVAFFSSLQDIVIDALRVEMLPRNAQGAAAATSIAGYRVGMLLAGAGAFVLASHLPWSHVYAIAAGFMLLCIGATLSVRRLQNDELAQAPTQDDSPNKNKTYQDWFRQAVIAPIADFMTRPSAIWILLFIALFKLGDAMAGTLATPFYLDTGFTKEEIAAVSKVFGLIAILVGTFLGGLVVKAMPIFRALFLCGTLQLLSNFAFVFLAIIGNSIPALTTAIAIENIAGGMGTAAFVAFMAGLCNVRFTATQYALLSALSSVGRTVIASSAGVIVAALGWPLFFAVTALFGLPGLIILAKLRHRL
ncbi:MAG: AmpG family muropeptide MFS transporter [Proteobacteria bacterium]|nr:AmpG family muropeptide MFS transporter [Pseudomonadota bacterium]